jgi:hypothetical protein
MDMRVAMTAVILIASMSEMSYALGGYNAAAAYGACQADALQGLHYAINGDCPNWEAWNHVKCKDKHHHTGVVIQHQGVSASQISKRAWRGQRTSSSCGRTQIKSTGRAVVELVTLEDAANSSALWNFGGRQNAIAMPGEILKAAKPWLR